MNKYRIDIEGMHCENCVKRVQSALEALDGVKSVSVSLKENCAEVGGDVKAEAMCEAVEELGFDVKELKLV